MDSDAGSLISREYSGVGPMSPSPDSNQGSLANARSSSRVGAAIELNPIGVWGYHWRVQISSVLEAWRLRLSNRTFHFHFPNLGRFGSSRDGCYVAASVNIYVLEVSCIRFGLS